MRVSLYVFVYCFLFQHAVLNAQKDSVTVYYFMTEECVVCQQYTPTLNKLFDKYNSDNLSFVGLFPNRFSTEEGIAAFQEKYAVKFPLKREYYQTKTKKFGVEITPEVVVYNETTDSIIYKGRIDNLFVRVGKRRRVVTSHDLEDVLKALERGEDLDFQETQAVGCYVNRL